MNVKDYVNKLEHQVADWFKKVPHLPLSGQQWLGENIWWLTILGAIAASIAVIVSASTFFSILSFLAAPATYYSYLVVAPYTSWSAVTALISLILLAVTALALWVAVKPLQDRTKKGWTLLFVVLLLGAVSIVLSALFTLSAYRIISDLIFGAIAIALGAYLLFEVRSQFAHTTGVRTRARTTKTAKPTK